MSPTVIKPHVWQHWREAHQMAVLAAFEDSITGAWVKEFCQGLSRDLGSDCRIVEHVWLFNTLRLRELREIAAEEASASDLVIISTHQSGSVPDEVRNWIDLWLQHRKRHQAILLALLDPNYEGASSAVESYLQKVASRGGMEFVVGSGAVAGTRWQSE
jgi:hypothetical protein